MTSDLEKPPAQANLSDTCTLLGLLTDPAACYAYPSEGNYCHCKSTPVAIRSSYQSQVCLTPEYRACPVYQNPDARFPEEIRQEAKRAGKSRWVLIAALVLMVVVSWVLYSSFGVTKDRPPEVSSLESQEPDSSAETQITMTPISPDETLPPVTAAPTDTVEPSATFLILSTPGPGMMTPFGPNGRYILHETQQGESLSYLADIYDTSIEVLQKLNIRYEGATLWVGQILVVMSGQIEFQGLQRFRVIRVEIRSRVVDISEEYEVSINNLRWLNSLGPDEWIPIGRWLIIPAAEQEPLFK